MKHIVAVHSQYLRRSVSALLRLMMAASVVFASHGCGSVQTPPATPLGSGTEADPYQITVLGNLVWMNDTVTSSLGKYYKMMNDIDASETAKWDSGKGFVPIGSDTRPFKGIFDGNNKKITGLTIDRPNTECIGLFGMTDAGSTIKNLGLEDFTIAGNECCGGLAGYVSAPSSSKLCVTNCYTSGSVSGSRRCGGLVGSQNGGSISNCYSIARVSGYNSCGGLVGSVCSGSIGTCHSSGSVSATDENCGGLVGNQWDGSISNCYSTARVSGSAGCGGLLGYQSASSISNCYSTGRVSGNSQCGGLVGNQSDSSISNCYSTGCVSGTTDCGGLVGFQEGGSIKGCYYDTKIVGQSDTGKGTPKMTAEMKEQATFSGWDFADVWKIVEGISYPYLKAFGRDDCDLTLSVVGSGTIVPEAGVTGHSYGAVVSLSAATADNYIFVEWVGGSVADPTSSNTTVLMDSSKSVTAHFRKVYEIRTLSELQAVNDDLAGHYILMNDIDASETAKWDSGRGFVPIGNYTAPFMGIFDGNNKKITGLTIKRHDGSVGLFGKAYTGSTIKNLGLEDFTIAGNECCGGLVGSQDGGSISNCYSSGSVSGGSSCGGLVGSQDGGSISNCYSFGSVHGGSGCGGLVGSQEGGSITNCYSTARVPGTDDDHGGLVGSQEGGSIRDCYYDTKTSDQSDTGKGTPKTTSEMTQQATFAGWDFASIWAIKEKETYPYLLDLTSSGSLQVSLAPVPQTTVMPSGSGTEADPYLITTLGNLAWMGDTVTSSSGKYYKMMNDIDASETAAWDNGKGFVPIGSYTRPFKGIFDGNNKKIAGLTIDRPKTDYIGLFGKTDTGSTIKSLGLEDFTIAGNECCGGLAGGVSALSSSTLCVTNCYTSGSVCGTSRCGGLVGVAWGSISDCYSSGSVSGTDGYCGGLAGQHWDSSISNCYSSGSVSGGGGCGGLVGYGSSGSISNCYSSGSVSGTDGYCGGLVGVQSGGSTSNCYSSGSVSSTDSGCGGLVGLVYRGIISNCYSTGRVSGAGECGGLVASQEGGSIKGCYYDTETSGQSDTGKGTPKTTAEMKQRATFAGWDFASIWGIKEKESYPYLFSLPPRQP